MNIIKRTTIFIVIIATLLCMYNTVLIQNEKYVHVYTYYMLAVFFLFVGLALYFRERFGVKLFSLLTWGATIYSGYVAVMVVISFSASGSFLFLASLFNMQTLISYLAQLLFMIGLVVYLQSTKKVLSSVKFKNNRLIDYSPIANIKLVKIGYFGLTIVAIAAIVMVVIAMQITVKATIAKVDAYNGKSQDMEKFLEGKYKEKFIISDFETEKKWRSSFESWQELTANVRPVGNLDITFKIRGCLENCKSDQIYSDNYINEYWAYEQKPIIETKLKEVYGFIPEYDINAGVGYSAKRKLADSPLVSFKTIQSDPDYAPHLELSTYQTGSFEKSNIKEAESRTRVMSEFMNSLGVIDFSFSYEMKNPISPSVSVYRASGVDQSDIHCSEEISIDKKEYTVMLNAANLKNFYGKSCSYKTDTRSGGGVVRGSYPE